MCSGDIPCLLTCSESESVEEELEIDILTILLVTGLSISYHELSIDHNIHAITSSDTHIHLGTDTE